MINDEYILYSFSVIEHDLQCPVIVPESIVSFRYRIYVCQMDIAVVSIEFGCLHL